MASVVKNRRGRGTTSISAKHQVTIPVDAMRAAGLQPGDRLRARADGQGRVVLERTGDPLDELLGVLNGTYAGFDLDAERDVWA